MFVTILDMQKLMEILDEAFWCLWESLNRDISEMYIYGSMDTFLDFSMIKIITPSDSFDYRKICQENNSSHIFFSS